MCVPLLLCGQGVGPEIECYQPYEGATSHCSLLCDCAILSFVMLV